MRGIGEVQRARDEFLSSLTRIVVSSAVRCENTMGQRFWNTIFDYDETARKHEDSGGDMGRDDHVGWGLQFGGQNANNQKGTQGVVLWILGG